MFQRLINFMPPHRVYIEPFVGGGAVLRQKRPAELTIGVDRNPAVISTWRRSVADLRAGWQSRAAEVAAIGRTAGSGGGFLEGGIGGRGGAAGSGRLDGAGGVRSREVVFHCADAVAFLAGYKFDGSELVYADPPYLLSTRRGGRLYGEFEMTDAQHRGLLRVLRRLPCRVMVSGYWSEMYSRALDGWHSFDFMSMTRGGRPAREFVWCNFSPPVELHDYTWLGENYRERERIARMRRRWVSRLAGMPRLQRLALQHAIAVVGGATR